MSLAFICEITKIIERYIISIGFNSHSFEDLQKIDKLYAYSHL